ncbi:collagen-binding domain-containing protein [Companilactobacillus farciminis]|uniref:collagen-binding domain-containing protein n=1 Tax=Companilactobacillus farciminis TaxID=1612 RepID=UPI00232B755C|nr:collagen-binding domain-containing protein [Companilactobacillus farciminis]WCG35233.1 choice-of-anchor A family protein [Companilactobacillus farciminis]
MLMKKGKEWALSCVAVSAAVLMGMSTTTQADAATTVNNGFTNSTSVSDNSNASQTANTTNDDATTQGSAQSTSNTATTQSSSQNQTAVTQSVNDDVQNGGSVSDDFSNENSNQLGYASNFHIFANEATLNAHTNGNLAVGTLNGKVNFGTNIHEGYLNKDISYVQNHNTIASSSFVQGNADRTNKVVFGESNDVDVTDTTRTKVDGTNIDHLTKSETYQDKNGNTYIDFGAYFSQLDSKSNTLSNMEPTVSVQNSDFPDRNQRVINLEDYNPNENNQIVINLDADVLNMDTPIYIYGLSADKGGTSVIINVDTKGQNSYEVNSHIKLTFSDGEGANANQKDRPNQETEYFDDNHLLWNFYDSTASDNLYDGTININRPFQGSVLAPKATVNANSNLDGNIVANEVNVNAETHRWDLQDDNATETEFERPVTIPGELPDGLPDEGDGDENDGGNIENPDEKEEEEDIDPDTGDLIEVDGGSEGQKPDTDDNDDKDTDDNEENGGSEEEDNESNGSEEENEAGEEDADGGLIDSDGNVITNGGSEGSSEGVLPNVTGNNSTSSQGSQSGSLPQTGETTGILATILGVILAAFGTILKFTRIKKED